MLLSHRGVGAAVTCALITLTTAALAQPTPGSVQIPLDQYERLTQGGGREPGAPVGYAFREARATVSVDEAGRAEVVIEADVRVLADEWTIVPLAADSAAIATATVDGQPAELVMEGGALGWPTRAAGEHRLRWSYATDTRSYGAGRVLSIATPPARTSLTATVPGADLGLTVLPAGASEVRTVGAATQITATLPAGRGAQMAWSVDDSGGLTLSRATYQGRLEGDTVRFEAELTVELEGRQTARVPLLSTSLALEEVRVDRVEAPIAASDDGVFEVPVSGRGRHRIHAVFQVPVTRDDGLPRIALDITPTPVSRFELTLPGERDVSVTPAAGVAVVRRDGRSVATFHVPMSPHVDLSWSEAVPEDTEVETRAHADLVHLVRPDEGVLSVRALATWEITRGAMSRAVLEVPDGVQVNAVESAAGVISDWRVSGEGRGRRLEVFLDREVEGALALEVRYERSWPARTRTTEAFEVPLLRAEDVGRQRGMIALLRTRELQLDPREEERVTRVGDNLLPPEAREGIEGTVAHTWRYLDEPPRLVAIGAVHEPEPARFDAQVDTLVSLGDVSTTVTTLIELDVKSGTLDRLALEVPEGLNLLEVSAPSLRHYRLEEDGGARRLAIELTQPMEGRFRVEVVCERITGQEEELALPVLGVVGAEVERGRLGVEALAPFQVDAAEVERLSPVDPSELPEQLLLRTDNPILHAFRYAQADPAPRFTVAITRHTEIETPHAVIDQASFRTLYTRGGVAVTMARFSVRNRREQFLRVRLPEGSEVWSAQVDGRSQTPALEGGGDDGEGAVLLNIVSAADAFPVELVYATPVSELGAFGRLSAELPRLDVVVTRTRWEVFVPDGASYAEPSSSMTLLERGYATTDALDGLPSQAALRVEVPTEGTRYVFQQMYAGRGGERVGLSMAYVSGWGRPFVGGLSVLGALLLCLGLLGGAVLRLRLVLPLALRAHVPPSLATYRDLGEAVPPGVIRARRRLGIGAGLTAAVGVILLAVSHGYLSAAAWPAILVAGVVGVGALGLALKPRIDAAVARRATPEPAAVIPVPSRVEPPTAEPPQS